MREWVNMCAKRLERYILYWLVTQGRLYRRVWQNRLDLPALSHGSGLWRAIARVFATAEECTELADFERAPAPASAPVTATVEALERHQPTQAERHHRQQAEDRKPPRTYFGTLHPAHPATTRLANTWFGHPGVEAAEKRPQHPADRARG